MNCSTGFLLMQYARSEVDLCEMDLLDIVLRLFVYTLVLLNLANLAVCYTIDPNCKDWTDLLMAAADEALRLAEYAAFRIDQNPPVGGIVENLIGYPDGYHNFKRKLCD